MHFEDSEKDLPAATRALVDGYMLGWPHNAVEKGFMNVFIALAVRGSIGLHFKKLDVQPIRRIF